MVAVGVVVNPPSASLQGYPPLRQRQGQALRVRALPAALTQPTFRVFCRHAEWLMMCRTRTTQQAHPAPGDVSYLADSMREILITVDDGKLPPSINVRDQNACLLPSSLMNTLTHLDAKVPEVGNISGNDHKVMRQCRSSNHGVLVQRVRLVVHQARPDAKGTGIHGNHAVRLGEEFASLLDFGSLGRILIA